MTENEKRSLGFGLGCGIVLGAGISFGIYSLVANRKLSSKAILRKVRRHFAKEGEIRGSFIHQEIEHFPQMDVSIPVYRGGIVRLENEMLVSYEFLADSKTGVLVDFQQIGIEEND
ncbi:Predicted small secreted protein [Pilibacter termitis]|jgi:predicted small secreted protein|uniref:Predicted small secreted protein n=1 Tax=Pilibacter termitis TaxID=263852 RepID=A0A1T4MYN9_9ENTE|nr:hypothetical protein [Pilibacter termitis]SJZ71966.1 Predicted small secreted protein [Pilibacter termitis]